MIARHALANSRVEELLVRVLGSDRDSTRLPLLIYEDGEYETPFSGTRSFQTFTSGEKTTRCKVHAAIDGRGWDSIVFLLDLETWAMVLLLLRN